MTRLAGFRPHRPQRTIRRAAETTGVGFLTGADIRVRFLPAEPNHGLVFRRVDLDDAPTIPARIEFAVPRERRTALSSGGATVELTEHVLAALAGLQIDNCLIDLDGPELPGGDGSALAFVEALDRAGVVEQPAPRTLLRVDRFVEVRDERGRTSVVARPSARDSLTIGYRLDYGFDSPIPPQTATVEIVPGAFTNELAYARTFVLESEVAALQAQGYGRRTTARDLLVFGPDGVIDNELRIADECARHKILDCLGDFALAGCDLHGEFFADRSGHRLNRELIRRLREAASLPDSLAPQRAA